MATSWKDLQSIVSGFFGIMSQTAQSNELTCEVCGEVFESEEAMNRHVREIGLGA